MLANTSVCQMENVLKNASLTSSRYKDYIIFDFQILGEWSTEWMFRVVDSNDKIQYMQRF